MKRAPSSPIEQEFDKKANFNISSSSIETDTEDMSQNLQSIPNMEDMFKQFTDKVIQTLKEEINALRADLVKKFLLHQYNFETSISMYNFMYINFLSKSTFFCV